ncbi:hypothetical protein Tdes44962_MAKER08098 [Teratosphaeria destructans]|uniref:Uncharacterized protein n=1 Tax=Teratosphaeria destructans TaxID=418781 RepID=A0A9W7SX70_9PEZI|nr:hypothetical protein Tdes44962_MAKER08098 [Teratosphaeria destructans]
MAPPTPTKIAKRATTTTAARDSKTYRNRRHQLGQLWVHVLDRFDPRAARDYRRARHLEAKAGVLERLLERLNPDASSSFRPENAATTSGPTTQSQDTVVSSDLPDTSVLSIDQPDEALTMAVPDGMPETILSSCAECSWPHETFEDCRCFCGLHKLGEACPWDVANGQDGQPGHRGGLDSAGSTLADQNVGSGVWTEIQDENANQYGGVESMGSALDDWDLGLGHCMELLDGDAWMRMLDEGTWM